MEIGKKIKQLRQNKGVTQETLANVLGVTYQAVSRWENGTTMPDITLLPSISIYFGVSIDDLFEFTDESQFKRIENMMNEKPMLTDVEFQNAKQFLEKQLKNKDKSIYVLKMLAKLCSHRSKSYNSLAVEYAKAAIRSGDTSKDMNNILRDSYGSPHTDWNFRNRHELIDFYYEHLEAYPDDLRAYRYLIPTLIADGRTVEAKAMIEKIRLAEKEELIYVFDVMLLRREGKPEECESLLQDMSERFGDSWYSWAIIADFKADDCLYDEAVMCFEKSFELQPAPRYTDSLEAIAHIYEIKKDYQKAVATYERIVDLLETDWNLSFGVTVNKYFKKIDELSLKV